MDEKQQQLMIPDRIKVGFQNREGTYTGKLAYVIYYDQKGVLRKEKSWQSWRDHKIPEVDFENVPTEGFVLNKGVGGQRHSYGWNARNEYIRVYDPRDFEFEISVANLLFILREGDCSRGKGLEGKFVYSWDGTELVLLPECSLDYQNSKQFTQLQGCSVKAKDLIPGASYLTKKQRVLIYLGKFNYHVVVAPGDYRFRKKDATGVLKKHVFWDGQQFVIMEGVKELASLNSDVVAPNYAELVDKYIKSKHGSKPVRLFLRDQKPKKNKWGYDYYAHNFFFQEGDAYIECSPDFGYDRTPGQARHVYLRHRVYIQDGVLHADDYSYTCYPPGQPKDRHSYYHQQVREHAWVEPTQQRLFVELESGAIFRFSENTLYSEQETNNGEED